MGKYLHNGPKKHVSRCHSIMHWMAKLTKLVEQEIRDFFNSTSVHGLKFITSSKTVAERFIWFFVSGFAVLGTLLMASTVWQTFRASPSQTIVENPSYPVWNVDFPALTVCNLNKVQYSRAKTLLEEMYSGVDKETENLFMDSLLALGMMRYPYYHHSQMFIRRGNKKLMDFAAHNLSEIMFKVMAKQSDIFGTCYWKGREIPCNVAFRLQITEEGFCYSFNSMTSENPNPPDMDSPPFQDSDGHKQPWRNNAAGKTTGLEVFFKSSEEDYLPSDQRIPGYNLIVHHPSEFPDVARALFLTRSNRRVTSIAVTASRVKASPELSRLSLAERACTLDKDGQDEVQENCKSKCRVLAIVKHCHCVPYFGFRRASALTPQCTIKHAKCLSSYNAQQRNIRPPEGSIGFRTTDLGFSINCTCPPSCSSTDYKTEFLVTNRMDPFPFDDYAYLDFFFKDLEIVSYVRDVKFGVMDLLVSFGGLAGLFLGFSLISAMEIIYYSVRIWIRCLAYIFGWKGWKKHKPANEKKITPNAKEAVSPATWTTTTYYN